MSESNIRFWPTWYSHRGVMLWSQTPTFLGNAQITLLLPGATGTQKNTGMHYILFIPPSWVWLDLLSTFALTHFLFFLQRKIQTSFLKTLSRGSILHPTLPVVRVTRRKLRMAQESDDLFVVNVVVWVLVVILAIVAHHCPLPRRVVR